MNIILKVVILNSWSSKNKILIILRDGPPQKTNKFELCFYSYETSHVWGTSVICDFGKTNQLQRYLWQLLPFSFPLDSPLSNIYSSAKQNERKKFHSAGRSNKSLILFSGSRQIHKTLSESFLRASTSCPVEKNFNGRTKEDSGRVRVDWGALAGGNPRQPHWIRGDEIAGSFLCMRPRGQAGRGIYLAATAA